MQHNGKGKTKDMQHNTMAKGNEGHATQHNGQRKRKTCNTTQWPKKTKDMQHNTMGKGKEKQ